MGLSPSAISGKKSKIIAGDFTVVIKKIKIVRTEKVSVGLSYDANLKWNMPICVERCRAKQKYLPFFGTVTECAFRKKIQSIGTYTKDATLRFGFFFREKRSVMFPRFGFFFSGFTDKG